MKTKLSAKAENFLTDYTYLVRDPKFFPKDLNSAEPDRFRVGQDRIARFQTQIGTVEIPLEWDTQEELYDLGFLRNISSGDHFIDIEGWDYIREHIFRINYQIT